MREKYAEKKLNTFPVLPAYFVFPFYPKTAKSTWEFLSSVAIKFFWLQTKQSLHITHKPVIYVDTDLDDKIPFTPERISTYMGFIPFFIKPLWMMVKRLGLKKSSQYISNYLHFLAQMYKNAATIYSFCFTTTKRPKYNKNRQFRTIHFFDPHLLCVPSLHVTIAAGTYAYYKKVFNEGLLPPEEAEKRIQEIKLEAIAIIESVLFVKQHSVNCISTAIYMLCSSVEKSFLSIEDAVNIIDELFTSTPEISPETRKEILEYFKYMYDRTLLESCYSDNWQDCLKHWIIDFAESTNQPIK